MQAWTALGRLYAEADGGQGHDLAATCYLQARSSDPLYARAWEGMAAMVGTRATGANISRVNSVSTSCLTPDPVLGLAYGGTSLRKVPAEEQKIMLYGLCRLHKSPVLARV